jgi:hypothetical protein
VTAQVRRTRRRDDGVASLELLGLVPLALVFAAVAVVVAGFMVAITSTNDAVRQGARAQSLGQSGCDAARDVLRDTVVVRDCVAGGGELGSSPSVRMVVEVPVPRIVDDLVPEVLVTRDAYLP